MEPNDLIVIGGGPAGLTAGIYASRYKLKTVILAELAGGTVLESWEVENYPGFTKIHGLELGIRMKEHAKNLGVEIIEETVQKIEKKGKLFQLSTYDKTYEGRALILSMGSVRRKLGIPGEKEYHGKGVSYCATCDAAFYKDRTAAVVGGSDAAVKAALILADHAKKVYLIYRKEKLRAEPVLVDRVQADPKIEIIQNSNVIEIKGKGMVNEAVLDTGRTVQLDGIFIEIGQDPRTELALDLGVMLENGLIKVNEAMSTNIPGVFSAGDITTGSNKFNQIVTAVGEGGIAAKSAYEWLKKEGK